MSWFAQTIECSDPLSLAEFYIGLVGGHIVRSKPDSVNTELRGLLVNFHSSPDYVAPTWPSPSVPMQHHFEFVVEDLEEAVDAAQQLGAQKAAHQDLDDPTYVVMLDPSGAPFCLISSDVAVR